jgi:hypothetical protein
MKICLFFIITFCCINCSYGQITKHNWLVGGTGFYNSLTNINSLGLKYERRTAIQISPNIGYFFFDKFAGGLNMNFLISRNKNIDDKTPYSLSKYTAYGFGPFIRYYFLKTDKPFNLLIDGRYQCNIERNSGAYSNNINPVPITVTNQYTKNIFSLSGGPVIYFNTSVGLEFLFGYTVSRYAQNSGGNNGFQAGIGLQVHLEKDERQK